MTIYINSDYKCYVSAADGRRANRNTTCLV